ncbi:MAG: tRNA (guanosine(37)-N1)-methyltransferase TrmD [Acidobacteria bacterium]|nr:tRNA (guanosine(37)-N1)-methyltransferase TrmD [Acidobacteriota bacterium]
MAIDIVTIFPRFFDGPFDHGIVRRAREAGLLTVEIHDLRQFTTDRHRTVDDRPFGGDEGMVFKPEPLFEAVEHIRQQGRPAGRVILLSARGKLFRQAEAAALAQETSLILLCGRYEGVDERVVEALADDELCIGDFVLSGGELAAAVVVDTIARLLPGALGNAASAVRESFTASAEGGAGLLDWPHYTRPAVFRDLAVPEVLLSGDHRRISEWRQKKALEKTFLNRPDLLSGVVLSPQQQQWLAEFREGKQNESIAKMDKS